MEKFIRRDTNDLLRILKDAMLSQNQGMTHFLNVFLRSPRSKYVDLVMDIGSKNPFSLSEFEKKILANYRQIVSKNHFSFFRNLPSQNQKNISPNQYWKISSNDSSSSHESDLITSHYHVGQTHFLAENLRESGLLPRSVLDSKESSMFSMSHLSASILAIMICWSRIWNDSQLSEILW